MRFSKLSAVSQKAENHWVITESIDMSDISTPLELSEDAVVDGNGYTITNLTNPLFMYLFNCTIKDVTFKDCQVTGETREGYMGLLCRKFKSGKLESITVTNCQISSEVYSVGAIAGYLQQTDCSDITISESSITGDKNVGGLCGKSKDSTLTRCTIRDCSVEGINIIGGLFGSDTKQNVSKKCTVEQTDVEGLNIIGGFSGSLKGITVNCVSHECIVTSEKESGGFSGIIGENLIEQETVRNCKSVNTTLEGKQLVGGFVGVVYETGLRGCSASGTVKGEKPSGFASEIHRSTITKSYCTTNLYPTMDKVIGFVKVVQDGTIQDCFTLSRADINYKKYIILDPSSTEITNLYWNMDNVSTTKTGTYTKLDTVAELKTILL